MHSARLRGLCPLLFLLAFGGCASPGDSEEAPPSVASPSTTPDSGIPGTVNPGTQTPGIQTPGTQTPGTQTPGTQTPGTQTPGTQTPGTNTPGTNTPGTKLDAGTDSGTTDSGTTDSGTTQQPEAGPTTPSGDCLCRGGAPTEADTLKNGPYKVENYTSGFMRASGVDSSTVWYPSDADPPFAGVAVVPGFVSPESSIRQWGPFLASHGIVAVTIGVPGTDQPNVRATKLLGTLEGLKAENTRSGSPLMGKLDLTRLGLAGWSMGGGGTLIAASKTPSLKAVVSFAAWGPTGGRNNTVPALMFEGTNDALAAGMSEPFYRDVPETTPKMVFEVQGAPHEVANNPKNSNGIIGSYGLSWFKVFLEGDERYRQFLTKPFPSICTKTCATNLKSM
jgi:dienelactone hydrolase